MDLPGSSGTSGGASRVDTTPDAFEGFTGSQTYGPFTLNPDFHEVEEIPMAAMEGEFAREFKRQFKNWLKENNRQE